jgi:hypothetical protein
MSETDKLSPIDAQSMTSVPMTKRQWQYLGIGLAFIAVGIGVFAVLKFLEGNVVIKNGEEYVYTVDPNVFLIMVVIALIGVLIVMLTFVEYRWQARSGENDVRVIDLIRKKAPEPVQKKKPERMTEKAPRKKVTVPPLKAEPEPVRGKVPVKIVRNAAETIRTRTVEPVRRAEMEPAHEKVPEPLVKKELETVPNNIPGPMPRMEMEPEKAIELDTVLRIEPEPIKIEQPGESPVKDTQPTILTEPARAIPPEPMVMHPPEPPKPERIIPVKVEAIGRCPMCSKVILLDQKECVKCGLRVDRKKLLPLER